MINTLQGFLIKLELIERLAKHGVSIAGDEMSKIQFQMILNELNYKPREINNETIDIR